MTYPQLKKILKLSPDNESLLNMNLITPSFGVETSSETRDLLLSPRVSEVTEASEAHLVIYAP